MRGDCTLMWLDHPPVDVGKLLVDAVEPTVDVGLPFDVRDHLLI